MTNADLSADVFSFFKQTETQAIIVCAGARNAPLVVALKETKDFKIYNFFEERSAAFFALGLIKASGKPVAVLTTSGTAAAELLPAVIEAHYQGLPLIAVTADRPKKYRGTGSPQSIDQVGLYSNYVESVYDIDMHSENLQFKWSLQKPLHLNVSFDEPLIDRRSANTTKITFERTTSYIKTAENIDFKYKKPLVILGEIPLDQRAQVIEFIQKLKAPVYAESLSHLKVQNEISEQLIQSSELAKTVFKLNLCDSVIRIGGVPTLRFWRDLEHGFSHIPVTNYSDLPFTGLSRSSDHYSMSSLSVTSLSRFENLKSLQKMDQDLKAAKQRLFDKYPRSEQSFTQKLSEFVNTDAVYLGNSLPIRNWDEFASCKSARLNANRGANGIDGQISAYLGWSENEKTSYCYVGDLTAMYDLAALGLTSQLNENQRNIVVLNNFGGQIFKRVFKNDDFINAHSTQFLHWAKMFNWNYQLITETEKISQIHAAETQFNIVELQPSAEQSNLFWNEWDELCQPR